MLDAETDSKRLRRHGHATAFQHGEGVAGRVPRRQNRMATGNVNPVLETNPNKLAALARITASRQRLENQLIHPRSEAHLTAELLDTRSEASHHRRQLEGADMGTMHGEDLGIGTAGHELLKNLAPVVLRIAHLAVELPIRKGAGPSLPELDVGLRLESTCATPETECVRRSLLDGLATFEEQGTKPHLRKNKGGEVTAGAGTDHHRATGSRSSEVRRSRRHGAITGVRGLPEPLVTTMLAEKGGFTFHLDIQAVDELNPVTLSRINTALDQTMADQALRWNAQSFQDRRVKVVGTMIEVQPNLA